MNVSNRNSEYTGTCTRSPPSTPHVDNRSWIQLEPENVCKNKLGTDRVTFCPPNQKQ